MKATSPSPPDLVNRHDVGMVQRRGRARLLLEPRDPVPIQGQGLRQDLDRHLAAEPRVLRPVDLSHSARTEGRQDLVAAEASAGGECHEKTVTAILAASLVETCLGSRSGFSYNRADTARAGDSAMDPLFRRVSFALAIWAGALCLCAQTLPSTGSIYGTALDEQGSSLPGVEVKLLGAGERAPVQTDSQGKIPVPVHLAGHLLRDLFPRRFRHGRQPGSRRRAGPKHPAARHDEAGGRQRDGDGPGRARDRPAQDRDRRDLRGEGAPVDPERAQHLGDPVGRAGGRHQPGQRRREHRGPGGARRRRESPAPRTTSTAPTSRSAGSLRRSTTSIPFRRSRSSRAARTSPS